jgi:hypothetical protein
MDKCDPEKNSALVVDEWGSWYAPLPGTKESFRVQQNSLRDTVLAALDLNIFARHADVALPRVDAIAARDASGRLWLALTNLDPDRPGVRRGALDQRHADVRRRRDPHRAAGRQRQPLRDAGHGRPQADHGAGPRRDGGPDPRAEVGDPDVRRPHAQCRRCGRSPASRSRA